MEKETYIFFLTDRYFIDRKKFITDLFVIKMKEIYVHVSVCIYKIVNLSKSYDNIHGMTYTIKIMLSGIAKIKTGCFDNLCQKTDKETNIKKHGINMVNSDFYFPWLQQSSILGCYIGHGE